MKTLTASFLIACATVALAQQPVPAKDAAKDAPKAEPTKAESKPAERKLGLAKPIVMEKDREVYGSEVTIKEAVKLETVLKDPKAYEGKKVKVVAEIEGVCQKKGCWMNVKDGEQKSMVKFKDYKFFVPLDVAGRTVTFEAVPQVKTVTEAMRRHYAEDAGKSKEEIEKIKGDQTQVLLMAEAVEIGKTAAVADCKKDDCCEGEVNADGSVKKKDGCCEGEKDAKKPAVKKADG
jgi:hypothetical protein